MEGEPRCEMAMAAIQALHEGKDPHQQEQAAKWLEELQSSIYAWKIADELLHRHADVPSCYFAAQTMRTKIQHSFTELPASSYESLRDSLLNQLAGSWPHNILTQLALAISDLALLMPHWKNPIDDILNRIAPSEPVDPSTYFVLLEVLTVYPEEVIKNTRLKLGQNRREEVLEELRSSANRVMSILSSALQTSNDDRVHCQTFRALGSWLVADALPANSPLLLTVLLPRTFDVLADAATSDSVHRAACDAASGAIILAEISRQDLDLVWLCLNRVYGLHDAYVRSVREEHSERPNNFCRLFTDLGVTLISDLIASPGQGLGDFRTIELLLLCMQHYDYEVAEVTFEFWYKFSEKVYKLDKPELQVFFKPYVSRLIIALCQLCQLEADREGLPDRDDDFSAFRERCNDLVLEVVFIVGSKECFRMLMDRLSQMSAQGPPWNVTEATLFTMTALGPNILPKEDVVIPPLIDAVLAFPDNIHPAVRYTGIYLLGRLAEWLSSHPKYLEGILMLVVHSLNTPVAAAGAYTLQQLCTYCREQLRPHAASLGDLVVSVQQQLGSTGGLTNEAIIGLLQGATHVLAESGDRTRILALLEVQLRPLDEMLSNPHHQASDRRDANDPVLWADRVAVVFKELSDLRPVKASRSSKDKGCNKVLLWANGLDDPANLALAQRAWTSLDRVLQRWKGDTRIVERVSRTIRYMVRFLSTTASPLVEPLVNRIVSIYGTQPHSCFLYLASILVDEFGPVASCVPGLISLVNALAIESFKLLDSPKAVEQNPDTIEDLFRLCTRCMQHAPLALMTSSCFRGILECALVCVSFQRREAHAAVMRFFCELLSCAAKDDIPAADPALRANTLNILTEMGAHIVHSLLEAAILKLPTYLAHDVAEVLHEIRLQVDRTAYLSWLESAARSLPSVGPTGTATVTPAQLDAFLQEAGKADDVKSLTTAVKGFARLYI